jgi:hypothetical protein
MLSEQQKARLNPEQLAIAEKWELEKQERNLIVDAMMAAEKAGDKTAYDAAADKLTVFVSDVCEHDRSIWSNCFACDEIERLLHPEFYDEEGERLSYQQIEKIVAQTSKGK